MSKERFAESVDAHFKKHPCEDAMSGKQALMELYQLMEEFAAQATSPDNWFKVQQLQTWTPLRSFWETLATDESLLIRAAAKGNICEANGEHGDDPEVGQIAIANFRVMQEAFNSNDSQKLQRELAEHPQFKKAEELWVVAGFSRFTPLLVVREL